MIEPMLRGEDVGGLVSADDVDYVMDFGLVRRGRQGLNMSNPIYCEVIPRELTWIQQLSLENLVSPPWYVGPDGRLDPAKLLSAFQEFSREHSEHWVERFEYKESGPQLLLQACLQRAVKGRGRIERECGLGRGRTDLLVVWPWPGGVQKAVIELEILHGPPERVMERGLEQTLAYRERSGAEESHLVVFSRDPARARSEKIYRRVEERAGRRVVVFGM